VHHVYDPLVAEAVAMWRAIVFCKEVGTSQVKFEGDSLGVVQAMNNGSSGWSFYSHLIDDIRITLVEFPSSIVRHVKRLANQAGRQGRS
jgi:ribonuclease HI